MAGKLTTGPQKERNTEMRKRLTLTLAIGAVAALVVAGAADAYKPTVVQSGNLVLTFNGGISPRALPKKKQAPIALNISGKFKTKDGSHPPALKTFIVQTDKNGGIDAKGYPTCKGGQLEARTTADARKTCPKAIVGKGKTDVEVQFPEQAPIPIKSQLTAFNGGFRGGKTTIFIHAYLSSPIAAAIVTTVTVKKIHKGKYGLESVAAVPSIANGAGSVTSFNLTINKKFTYKGKKKSYLTARCPTGTLYAQGEAKFRDGTRAKGGVVRPCTPKG
jgi:hypothetical protein